MTWDNLNGYYEKINKIAAGLWRDVLEFIPNAKLSWYNLHNVKRNGKIEVEFIPLPEVEAEYAGKQIDFGVSFMGEIWAEVTVSAENALELIDFCNIAKEHEIEVYGTENYTEDFYHSGMDIGLIKDKIKASGEEKIAIYFPPREEIEKNKDFIRYIMNI